MDNVWHDWSLCRVPQVEPHIFFNRDIYSPYTKTLFSVHIVTSPVYSLILTSRHEELLVLHQVRSSLITRSKTFSRGLHTFFRLVRTVHNLLRHQMLILSDFTLDVYSFTVSIQSRLSVLKSTVCFRK